MRVKHALSALGLAAASLIAAPQAQAACSIGFTFPGNGATVTSPSLTVKGTGGGDAQHGIYGSATARLNGTTIFNHSGVFTVAMSFFQSAGVAVTLQPGANHFDVSGTLGGCSASDSMVVFYDPVVDAGKNQGSGNDDLSGNAPKKCAGNPINFSVGNKFQEEEDFRRLNGSFPLRFGRSYNSLDGFWRHSYSTRLKIETGRTTLTFADGRQSSFAVAGAVITPSPTELGSLTIVGTNWRYVSASNEVFEFDSTGRLTKWTNPHGLFHGLTYSGATVTVADNFGNTLQFTQDAKHQPLTMTSNGISIAYGYDGIARLTSVARTTGATTATRTYHYENTTFPRLLTGITDERNVRYATWEYDSRARATKSVHAGGVDEFLVAYNVDGTTTVTNPLGKQTKYHYAVINGVKRITQIEGQPSPNCPASDSSYIYDARGLLEEATDSEGNVTKYAYNTRGLETSRTEAYGTAQERETTTTWHATLALPLVITEPERTITHTYDAQGRLLTRTIQD